MRAGKLRHPIVIQTIQETRNGYGEVIPTWVTFASVRASVEPLQGKEYFAANSQQTATTTRFRIRYLAGITASMRISFNGEVYDIESIINPNERNREIHIMTVKRSGEQ